MLFIESIFKQGSIRTRRGRFGYADDICQLVASPSLEENYIALQHCTEDLRQWRAREGLTFDFSKTKLNYNISHVELNIQTQHALYVPPPQKAYIELIHPLSMVQHAG